jgi:hypothetical protein
MVHEPERRLLLLPAAASSGGAFPLSSGAPFLRWKCTRASACCRASSPCLLLSFSQNLHLTLRPQSVQGAAQNATVVGGSGLGCWGAAG